MKNISRFTSLFLILVFGVFLGGCMGQPAKKSVDVVAESPVKIIKGVVGVAGKTVMISSEGVLTEIFSRKMNLAKYDGKVIEVEGQFSGTTLFVDEVRE